MAREPDRKRQSPAKKSRGADEGKDEKNSAPSEDRTSQGGAAPSGEDAATFAGERYESLRGILEQRGEEEAEPLSVARSFAAEWLPWHAVEIEMLTPALQESGDEEKSRAVRLRKDVLNLLLVDLLRHGPDEMAPIRLAALADAFNAVEKAAYRERDGLAAEKSAALGEPVRKRFESLKERFSDIDRNFEEAMDLLAPVCLFAPPKRQRVERDYDMATHMNTPERDDRGRFMSEDESEGRGRRGGERESERSRGRYSENERNGGRAMARGNYDDERSSGRNGERGHGGWFGDREGHSEASRRGWDNPDHGESGWYGDREGHSEASRRGWDNPNHGESGWYGDREGHSEASRRGWDNPRHGDSGWYGDREGHSEAARRGWEEGHESQRRSAGEERAYRSRSGNDDNERRGRYEDERYSRGSSQRGWSGDPEGHSEAARRGWERGHESQRHDEDRAYRSRSGNGDNDRQRGRYEDERSSRGSSSHGGWSGDPEGHSEASRRGWEHRR